MAMQFNIDETDSYIYSYFLMATGRCDNGCMWNCDVHSLKKSKREILLDKVLDVKTCCKCFKSSPESLEALCRSKIVSSEKLVKMACLVLPSILIPSLMQYAARRFDTLKDFRMRPTLKTLIQHWPFRVLDISALTRGFTLTRGISSVRLMRKLAIDRFLESISSGNLMNELVVLDCDDVLAHSSSVYFFDDIWGYTSFLNYIWQRTEDVISTENMERKYVLRTNLTMTSCSQVEECVQCLRFLQQKNSPFDVQIVKITCTEIDMADLLEIFTVIDPKYVESVCLTEILLTSKDVQDLDTVLQECQCLSSLFLDLGHSDWDNTADAYEISNAISTLLVRHHLGITRLQLRACPMSGVLEMYRLPMFLKELRLCCINLADDDFEQLANLYHFPVLTRFSIHRFYICEGLVKFISNHASTLTKLEMTYSMDHHSGHIRALADHLRRFGILEDFTYSYILDEDFVPGYIDESELEILQEFVENFLVIESLTHLHLMTENELQRTDFRAEFHETMRSIVDRISAERKNPFDFCCIECV